MNQENDNNRRPKYVNGFDNKPMTQPGLNNEIINVWLENDWFNQNITPIISRTTIQGYIRYTCYYILHFFGCTPLYNAMVLGEPEQLKDGIYRYPLTIIKKKIRLFGIVIKTINTDKI